MKQISTENWHWSDNSEQFKLFMAKNQEKDIVPRETMTKNRYSGCNMVKTLALHRIDSSGRVYATAAVV